MAEPIPTMLSQAELEHLEHLTRERWDGQGHVVELGPWLGASSAALARGMRANPRRSPAARLHVVDTFTWQEFMEARAPLGRPTGASFEDVLRTNLAAHEDVLVVHRARLPDDGQPDLQADLWEFAPTDDLPLWDPASVDGAVSVLFVDGAKSWQAMAEVLIELTPRMPPGSHLVLQDFKTWAAFWVPMLVAALEEAAPGTFAVERSLPHDTLHLRVERTPGADALEVLPRTLAAVGPEAASRWNAAARSMLAGAGDEIGAHVVGLGLAAYLAATGRPADAGTAFRRSEARWPISDPVRVIEQMRPVLARRTGRPCPPRPRSRAAAAYHRVARARAALRRR